MINKKQTVLVSGVGGLLGNELVSQLLNYTNHNIIALTSQRDKLEGQFKGYKNLLVLNVDNWIESIGLNVEIDTFINCAFPRSSDPEQLAEGVVFTENIIKNAISLNTRSIINISSQSVYSQKEKSVTDESLPVAPESLYGMVKYATERIVKTICEQENISYSNIRLASLTGLNFGVRLTNRFVKSVLTNQPITVNNGNQKISYLEVRDAASALLKMLEVNSSEWKNIYNLGNNKSFSLIELVDIIKNIASKHSINQVNVVYNKGKDNFNNLIDSRLFYTDFNWEPGYDIKRMIEELFVHYKEKE